MSEAIEQKLLPRVRVPAAVIIDLHQLKNSILLQEVFQFVGLAVALFVLCLGLIFQNMAVYSMFIVPFYYTSVARSDYMIGRNGKKIHTLEKQYGFVGNETMHKAGGSRIWLFDIPIFALLTIGAKVINPYGLYDLSETSLIYWVLSLGSCALFLSAPKQAQKHDYAKAFA